jgi:hypothetical protein
VLTGHGQVTDVNTGVLSALFIFNVHPLMAVTGLIFGIGKPLVANKLVFAGYKAILAAMAS